MPLWRGLRRGEGSLKIGGGDFCLRVARQGVSKTPIARQGGFVLRGGEMAFERVGNRRPPVFAQGGDACGV